MAPNVPIVNGPNLYVNGFLINFISGSELISVGPGYARDSTNTNDIVVSNASVINGLAVGLNGVDAVPVALNSLYAIYVIGDSNESHPSGFILSLNSISPVLPSGYDMFRRVGWAQTQVSGSPFFLKWYQYGVGQAKQYFFDLPVTVIANGTSVTFVPIPSGAPPISTIGIYTALFTAGSTSSLASFLPFGSSQGGGLISFGGINGGTSIVGQLLLPLDFNPATHQSSFQYKVGSGDHLVLTIAGFYDYLN